MSSAEGLVGVVGVGSRSLRKVDLTWKGWRVGMYSGEEGRVSSELNERERTEGWGEESGVEVCNRCGG